MARTVTFVLFLLSITTSLASPGRLDPTFTPTPPPNGKVHALEIHPDGGIIVGGEFTEPRAYLAKYDANGILDTTFAPTLDGPVFALESIRSFDLILLGGSFENLNSISSKSLVGLNYEGQPHPNSKFIFGDGFDGPVHAIEFVSSSRLPGLLVAGEFTTFQGLPANNLAGFEADFFSKSITFRTNYQINGKVNTISDTSGSEGRFVGGTFTRAGTSTVENCALISGTKATSPNFLVSGEVFSVQPYLRNETRPLQFRCIIVGGDFPSFGGQPAPAPGIGLLFDSGQATYDFPPNDFTNAAAVFLDSDNNLIAGSKTGELWKFSISDPPRPGIPIFQTTTSFYHPSLANGKISTITQDNFGRYFIAGDFTEVDGTSRPCFARLCGPLGCEPPTPPAISSVFAADDRALVEIAPVSRALAYQTEYRSEESTRRNLQPESARLKTYLTELRAGQDYEVRARAKNINGWSDWGAPLSFQSKAQLGDIGLPLPSFVPSHPVEGFGQALHLASNGDLLLRGSFQEDGKPINGVISISPAFKVNLFYNKVGFPSLDDFRPDPRGGIIARLESYDFIRVNEDGEVDPDFESELIPQTSRRDFAVQSDGKVILVDPREDDNGAIFIPLARLNSDGSRDTSFDPVFTCGANVGTVEQIVLLPDNSMFALGEFDAVDGIPSGEVVKLTPAGEVDQSFQLKPATSSFWIINDAAVDSSGMLLLAGTFQDASAGGRVNLTRLTTSGNIDSSFPDLVFSNGSAAVIEIQGDGKILASRSTAGAFEINGVPTRGIFRLTPDGEFDPTFNPGLGFSRDTSGVGIISSIKSLVDGTIAVSGSFDRCHGQPCDDLAFLRGNETPSNYQLWLRSNGLPPGSDPSSNTDDDSLNLAIEFAYNLSPLRNDSISLLQAFGTGARITAPLMRGVSTSAYFSPDLQTWQEIFASSDWTLAPPSDYEGEKGYFRFFIDSVN